MQSLFKITYVFSWIHFPAPRPQQAEYTMYVLCTALGPICLPCTHRPCAGQAVHCNI